MTTASQESASKPAPANVPARGALLQRKCACGSHAPAGAECESCKRSRLGLQRKAESPSPEADVPAIVHDVLRSPGAPMDAPSRAFFEPRFGRDLSGVRLHTDAKAAASARAVDALAYTVGNNVVFGAGQHAPHTTAGRHLLAHELTHTIQQGQRETASPDLRIEDAASAAEREGDEAADAVMRGFAPHVARRELSVARQPPTAKPAKPAPKPAAKTGSFNVAMTPFVTGVSGTIAFDPDTKSCPVCKSIRLVQIVRVFEKPGVEYKWPGGEAPREKVKTAEDKSKGVKAGYFVDHQAASCSKGNKCSLYYRDHWANPSQSQDGSNDGTTAKKASLWDKPTGDADDVFEFETCARCHDSGAYLRCVDWGFSADSAGKATRSSTSEHAAPSATFNAAIAKFNSYYANP